MCVTSCLSLTFYAPVYLRRIVDSLYNQRNVLVVLYPQFCSFGIVLHVEYAVGTVGYAKLRA